MVKSILEKTNFQNRMEVIIFFFNGIL